MSVMRSILTYVYILSACVTPTERTTANREIGDNEIVRFISCALFRPFVVAFSSCQSEYCWPAAQNPTAAVSPSVCCIYASALCLFIGRNRSNGNGSGRTNGLTRTNGSLFSTLCYFLYRYRHCLCTRFRLRSISFRTLFFNRIR